MEYLNVCKLMKTQGTEIENKIFFDIYDKQPLIISSYLVSFSIPWE